MIACNSLHLSNAHLIRGTGPLFHISGPVTMRLQNGMFSTSLTSSRLSNVTSCHKHRDDVSTTAQTSQKIVGCRVNDCSNHLYGTAIRDMNSGGNLLCHNTTFLHCTTEVPTNLNQYFYAHHNLVPSIKFHYFRLCTFLDCSATNTPGGAISSNSFEKTLKIEDCSFDSCRTRDGGMGGAVFHNAMRAIDTAAIFKSVSFLNCSTNHNGGGSISIFDSVVVSISECMFVNSQCESSGGAVALNQDTVRPSEAILSNCLFQRCTTTSTFSGHGVAGAAYFENLTSVRLDSLCFRNNQAGTGTGQDLFFDMLDTWLDQTIITNCVSTSMPANKRCSPSSHSNLLPDPTITPTVSLTFEQIEDQAKVNVELNSIVSGKVLVLVTNKGGTRVQQNGQPPHIARVLSFDVITATSGSTIVSCGEDGLLQLPLSDYKIVTSSFFPKPLLLAVNPASLNDKKTKVTVTMKGSLLEGEYTLTLSDNSSETKQIEVIVTFASSVGTLEEIVYDAETPANEKLSFNTKYSVIKMEKGGEKTLITDGLFFTIDPEPERLTGITAGEATPTSACTTTLLTFSSRVLQKKKEYKITLVSTAIPNHPSHERTINVKTDENGELKAFTATLYPFETEEAKKAGQLDFGVEYKVKSFFLDTTPILFDEGKTTFTTPPEPARIEECVKEELSGDLNSVSVVFSGRALKDGLGLVYATNGTSFWESTSNMDCSSESQCTATFLTGIIENSSQLSFGQKYSVVSTPSTPSLFVVNENVELAVPKAPTVTETETELNTSTCLSFRVVVSGDDLPSTGTFNASFEGMNEKIEIIFDENEGKSDWIEVRKNTAMQFNTTYTLSTLIRSESGKEDQHVLCSGVEMKTPKGPTLLRVGEVKLEGQEKETAVMDFEMTRMPVGSFTIEIIDSLDQSQTKIELTLDILSVSDATAVIRESVGEGEQLLYGHSYTVVGMSSIDIDVSISSSLALFVPTPSHFESISFSANTLGTSLIVSFSGSNLAGSYAVTLNSGFTFVIAASSPTQAASSAILLGWPDALPFSSSIPILSITSTSSPTSPISIKPALSLDTPPKPTELTLFVNSLSTDSTRFCGEKIQPCSTFDPAWVIVKGIDVKRATLAIIDSASLNAPITISDKMVVLFSNGGNKEPKLTIPSSATMEEKKGMVVVSDATLDIVDVDVVIESTLTSFVFLSAFNSDILVKDGSISGRPSANSPIANDDGEEENKICSWSSGILQIENSSTTISFSVLKNLSQGAINMKGGDLTIETSSFHDNTPTLPSFPTARRNIHCSDNGSIEIGSLNGGDGMETPSAWISVNDCSLTAKEAISHSPFFIPTLSTNSSSNLDKKTKSFSVVICGSTLIPCGLTLEVFEVNENKSEGKQTEVDLDLDTTSSFTETEVSLSIALSSLSSLSPSLEWRGRLRFGENLKTNESFVIQKSSSDRLSQSVQENMKWWLPLAIVAGLGLFILIVIVCLCWRRRKQNQTKSQSTKAEELDYQDDIEKMDVVDRDTVGGSIIASSAENVKDGALSRVKRSELLHGDDTQEIVPLAGQAKVLDVIVCEDKIVAKSAVVHMSLYDAFHKKDHRPLPRRSTEQKLVRGLLQLSNSSDSVRDLSKLSPHRVFIEGTELVFKLRDEISNTTKASTGTNPRQGEAHEEIRWRAPEEAIGEDNKLGEKGDLEKEDMKPADTEIDHLKASVFRLGLILYEIETGLVPFGETDAMNASRQLCSGMLPPMDGIRSSEMKTLISDCLTISVGDRPTLKSVLEKVNSIGCDDEDKSEIFKSN
ncbi:hypothetical protein BLNAU_9645 [Blattamonas nauphoetae]|uniref:Protein kinase domain-containing protein n=1 Tax=Blattamonas nauphoetae TaxID=2049346 RepID=A0ABQ9XVB0_9EUKA|nr:hypothetical protein BLNAU_9645 [Blattamonas nauphoetae]